jgi:hypothetical protein
MKLLQVQGVKEAPHQLFQSLATMKETQDAIREAMTAESKAIGLKGSMMARLMRNAVGGDNLGALL